MRWRRRHPVTALDDTELATSGVAPRSNEPRHIAELNDMGREIADAISGLPEDQRTAIILAEYEQLGIRDIAEIMQRTVRSVESRLYRARRNLRKKLAAYLVAVE